MNTLMIAEQPRSLPELNDDLRQFAEVMRMIRVKPTLTEVIAAVKPAFPDNVVKTQATQELLDEVGVVVIVDIGQGIHPMRISWSAAATQEDADAQQKTYQGENYRTIRKALGIDYHWVCLVFEGFLADSDSVLIEGIGNFRAAGEPDCWVFDMLAAG